VEYFDLYLQGSSCLEIAQLNPGIDLGAIVNCKVRYEWDKQKAAYIEDLTVRARQDGTKIYLESIRFLGNLLGTVHARFDTNFAKFRQSKDPSDLGAFEQIDGGLLKEYRSNLDLLFRLMGQDAKAVKSGPQVNVNIASSGDTSVGFEDDQSSSELLKRLADSKNKE